MTSVSYAWKVNLYHSIHTNLTTIIQDCINDEYYWASFEDTSQTPTLIMRGVKLKLQEENDRIYSEQILNFED